LSAFAFAVGLEATFPILIMFSRSFFSIF